MENLGNKKCVNNKAWVLILLQWLARFLCAVGERELLATLLPPVAVPYLTPGATTTTRR